MHKKFIQLLCILCILMLFPLNAFATTYTNGKATRIYGTDRYETSYALAEYLSKENGKFDTIIIAYGGDYADSLSGSYLSIVRNAPILLVDKQHETATLNKIRQLCKDNATVYVLGGTSVISYLYEQKIASYNYNVIRLGGNTKYDTNVKILEEAYKYAQRPDYVIIATGKNYADAISASASGEPILLVNDSLTTQQKAYINKAGPIQGCLILGGYSTIPAHVENQLNQFTFFTRIGGDDRYHTSYLFASYMNNKLHTPTNAVITYANSFPDGICAGLLAHKKQASILLASSNRWQEAHNYMYRANIKNTYFVGGTAVLPNNLEYTIANKTIGVATLNKKSVDQTRDYPIRWARTEYNSAIYGDGGYLYIPKLNSYVSLYKYKPGEQLQGIVDESNSAAMYDISKPNLSLIWLFDHASEGFYNLWKLTYGDTVQIVTPEKIRVFVCVGEFVAKNDGKTLKTTYGLDLYRSPYYDLTLATCATANAQKDFVRTFIEVTF